MRFNDLMQMNGVALYSNENRDSLYVDVEVEFVLEIGKRSFEIARSRWDPSRVETIRWNYAKLRRGEHMRTLWEIKDVGIDKFGVDPSLTKSRRQ